MKKKIFASIASLAMTTTFWSLAAARTQPANHGTARIGAQANLFNYTTSNGSVMGLGFADWTSGFVLDSFGAKNVRIAARASAAGAQVRLISSDFFGNVTSVTGFQPIPVAAASVPLLFAINVLSSGTIVVDAMMNNGALIGTAEYNP